jgi:hypothetical protein
MHSSSEEMSNHVDFIMLSSICTSGDDSNSLAARLQSASSFIPEAIQVG